MDKGSDMDMSGAARGRPLRNNHDGRLHTYIEGNSNANTKRTEGLGVVAVEERGASEGWTDAEPEVTTI